MRANHAIEPRNELIRELKLKQKEYAESKLAINLLKHLVEFNSVTKVSAAITAFIKNNHDKVISIIKSNTKIREELTEPYFGSHYKSTDEVDAELVLKDIVSILQDNQAKASTVMQIHCIFIHKIYDHLTSHPAKQDLVGRLFTPALFSRENRSRQDHTKKVEATNQLGISKHPVFSKMLGQSNTRHIRAIDKFTVDCSSSFFKSTRAQCLPIVCGPSGHTGSLLLGAALYGNLNEVEMEEYTLACFAFLTAGGNHSFHEVSVVARQIGVEVSLDEHLERLLR